MMQLHQLFSSHWHSCESVEHVHQIVSFHFLTFLGNTGALVVCNKCRSHMTKTLQNGFCVDLSGDANETNTNDSKRQKWNWAQPKRSCSQNRKTCFHDHNFYQTDHTKLQSHAPKTKNGHFCIWSMSVFTCDVRTVTNSCHSGNTTCHWQQCKMTQCDLVEGQPDNRKIQ